MPSPPDNARQRLLIIDGHSAIFSIPEIRAWHDREPRRGRRELINWFIPLADTSDDLIMIVFDGKGLKKERDENFDTLGVVYSPSGQTADAVIERLAAKHAGNYDITVASNDRMVLDGISASGAHPISIKILIAQTEQQLSSIRKKLKKYQQNGNKT